MEIICLKSAVKLFFRLNPIGPWAEKVPGVKFGGMKKSGTLTRTLHALCVLDQAHFNSVCLVRVPFISAIAVSNT